MQRPATEKPIFPMRLASFVSWIFNGVGSVLCSVLWRATFPDLRGVTHKSLHA